MDRSILGLIMMAGRTSGMNLAAFNLASQKLMAFFQLATVLSLESFKTSALFIFVASREFVDVCVWLALFI